jgi:hypothetical protein
MMSACREWRAPHSRTPFAGAGATRWEPPAQQILEVLQSCSSTDDEGVAFDKRRARTRLRKARECFRSGLAAQQARSIGPARVKDKQLRLRRACSSSWASTSSAGRGS